MKIIRELCAWRQIGSTRVRGNVISERITFTYVVEFDPAEVFDFSDVVGFVKGKECNQDVRLGFI